MNGAGYKRWAKTEWWSEGYERLWEPKSDAPLTEGEIPSTPKTGVKETVIYLTADADEELSELMPDETYIIGGIVDRNRYKV